MCFFSFTFNYNLKRLVKNDAALCPQVESGWLKQNKTYIIAFSQLFAEKYLSEWCTSSLLHCFCNIVRVKYASDKILKMRCFIVATLVGKNRLLVP